MTKPNKRTPRRQGKASYEVTPELCAKVESLAAQGLTLAQICSCIGWNFQTLCNKRRQHKELVDAIKNGQDKGLAQVTNALFTNAKGGNLGAQCFYLKNRDRANWRDKWQEDEPTVKNETHHTVEFIDAPKNKQQTATVSDDSKTN